MTEIDQLLGKSLSKARERVGMTPGELGRRARLSEATVTAFEEGRRRATALQLFEIADCLDVPVEGLFDWAERPVPQVGATGVAFGSGTEALAEHYAALSRSHRAAIYAFLLALGRD
ncbi:helix-turn-helix domain-containing protein [Shimia aestuarii]|uniref:helix-turn-helix domain-containing protein n=1 Tax=Shimia aestuarii TaxID=254406 RepID=UPI001FB1DBF5|nr:helix-turn-helix transcriptional regulator [Shimia aestuarii]